MPAAIKSRPQDLVFFAFHLLHWEGQDLRPAPLEEPRAKLRYLMGQVPGKGSDKMRHATVQGIEVER